LMYSRYLRAQITTRLSKKQRLNPDLAMFGDTDVEVVHEL